MYKIKEKIFASKHIEGYKYNLTFQGQMLKNLNSTTIYKAGLVYDSMLVVDFHPFNITVRLDKEDFEVQVDPDNKVETIADAVSEIKNLTKDRFDIENVNTTAVYQKSYSIYLGDDR